MHTTLTISLFLLSFTALMGGVKTPESPVLLSWAVKEEFVVDAHGASTRVKISHAEDASGNKRIFITDVGSIRYLLKGAFALTDDMANHEQLLDDLLDFVHPIGKLLETPIKNKINALGGSNKIQFLKDLAETKVFGRSMDEVTEGILDAWGVLLIKNVPDALRKNIKFLKRLSDNPGLSNFVDNLTVAGRTSLSSKIAEWILYYDIRPLLKNGNIDQAITHLGEVRINATLHRGREYVRPLEEGYSYTTLEKMLDKIDEIISSTTDVNTIANVLEIPPHVVQFAKEHLFIRSH